MSLSNFQLGEVLAIIPANAPVDSHTAGVTGLWVSGKDASRLAILVEYAAGTASDEVAITVNQATSSSGAVSKVAAIITSVRAIVGATAIGQSTSSVYTVTAESPAVSAFTPSGQSADQAQYLLDCDLALLDATNGFDYLQVTLGTPNNTRLCSVNYILYDLRHPQSAPTNYLT